MKITVYGRKGCVQCRYTCVHLDRREIPYDYVDVDEDAKAAAVVTQQARLVGCPPTLPLVSVDHGQYMDWWFGFKIDKIKGLRNG